MNIPTYNTFKEKSNHFNIMRIDNYNDFKDLYNKHLESSGIYRGVKSSSYKTFSSKQREFFETDKNIDYISLVKQNRIVTEYFNLAKIPCTELSYLSLLQHYGKPTPFIDFTKNFTKALYFALDEIDIKADNKEINNYFTILFISTEDLELLNASEQFEGGAKVNRNNNYLFENYDDYSKNNTLNHTEFIVKTWLWDIFYLGEDSNFNDFIKISNNHRIIMQEGIFIHNEFKEDKQLPLEEALKVFLKNESEQNYYSCWDEMDIYRSDIQEKINNYTNYIDEIKNRQKRLEENIITSYEINKELIPRIQKEINIPGKELIYFDLKEIFNKYI